MTERNQKMELTEKQERFVAEYIRNKGNATAAYKAAGYKCKNDKTTAAAAIRLLSNVKVSRAIREHRKKLTQRLELEEDFELKEAIRIFKMCSEPHQVVNMKGQPVKDENGNFVLMFDSKGANMALQTICKIRGKFIEKKQVDLTLTDRSDWLADALKSVKENE